MPIRVLAGTGTGPTALAAYDAALLAAGVGNYNLVRLSSVLPADASLERPAEPPDLGPVGAELRVVEASAVADPGGIAGAGLGWVRRNDGSGLFYEEGATMPTVQTTDGGQRVTDPVAVQTDRIADRVRTGLEAGVAERGWTVDEPTVVTAGETNESAHAAAVVVAAYGRARKIAGTE